MPRATAHRCGSVARNMNRTRRNGERVAERLEQKSISAEDGQERSDFRHPTGASRAALERDLNA